VPGRFRQRAADLLGAAQDLACDVGVTCGALLEVGAGYDQAADEPATAVADGACDQAQAGCEARGCSVTEM
jgi:hypothetical protein